MAAQPLICWVTRGVRAAVEEHARSEGVAFEEAAGDLLAEAVRARALPQPPLPDLSQPTAAMHERARLEAQFEAACGSKERAAAMKARFDGEQARGPRKIRFGKGD